MSSKTPMRSHDIQKRLQIFGVKGTLHAFLKGKKRTLGTADSLREQLNNGTDLPGRYFKHIEDREVTTESLNGLTATKWQLSDCTLNGLTASVDNERESIIYLDFWKASDIVPHNFLAAILESYGFDGWIIRCIKELVEWPHPTSCSKWFNVQMETGNECSSRVHTDTSAF